MKIVSLKKIIIILFVLILSFPAEAKYGWLKESSGTNMFLYGVCFVDSLYGWAVGDEGLIIHTEDGGKTWEEQEANAGSWLLSVHFLDRNNGWAVGDFGRIRHTSNGGASWKIQQSLTFPEVLNAVHFADLNNGWATGAEGIIHTSDGGNSWHYQTSDTISASKSIFFINNEVGWACGANGTIVRTVDSGKNWIRQQSGNNGIIYDVFFVDLSKGWAVSRTEPKILRTTNGGNTWLPNQEEIPGFFKKIEFIDENNGWAVGPGGIIKTSDGGKSWKVQIPDSRYNLWWASFSDNNKGWAVGGEGTILKTDNGGFKFEVDFSANNLIGTAPLSTTFTDLTEGEHTQWQWDFGDGGTHTTQNPVYFYQEPGIYTVKLAVSDSLDSDSKTKIHYINVTNPNPLIADFKADTTFGTTPLTVKFEDLSQGDPDSWDWDFGDGGTHKTQSPLHVYQESGTFTVSLTIKKVNEESTEIKKDYIIVKKPISVDEIYSSEIVELNISPNPTTEFLNISINNKKNQYLKIDIINEAGQNIGTILDDYVESGIHNILWDFEQDNNSKLAKGTYFITLQMKSEQKYINKIYKIIYY